MMELIPDRLDEGPSHRRSDEEGIDLGALGDEEKHRKTAEDIKRSETVLGGAERFGLDCHETPPRDGYRIRRKVAAFIPGIYCKSETGRVSSQNC
jgi:hypothetical protein